MAIASVDEIKSGNVCMKKREEDSGFIGKIENSERWILFKFKIYVFSILSQIISLPLSSLVWHDFYF